MKKYKARVKGLKEILENEVVAEYREDYIAFKDGSYWIFSSSIFSGRTLEITEISDNIFDYEITYDNGCFAVKKEWLEDIREIKDPLPLKIDTKVIYSNYLDDDDVEPYLHGYFADFVDERFYVFADGKTSWTANKGDVVPVNKIKLFVGGDE